MGQARIRLGQQLPGPTYRLAADRYPQIVGDLPWRETVVDIVDTGRNEA